MSTRARLYSSRKRQVQYRLAEEVGTIHVHPVRARGWLSLFPGAP